MASPPKPRPVRHLVALCDRLDLEPVLRHMRQSECLTGEHAQLIRSHPTSHLRIEALVDLLNSEERVAEFMLALWATGQTDLAELIDPPSDPTMTASQSQPSLPTRDAAAEAPRASEAASSQGSSSSQAEVLQLPAELEALILRRVQEAMSSPQLPTALSGGSLGASEAQEAPSSPKASAQPSGLPTGISAGDSARSSTAPHPPSQSEPGSTAQGRVQEAATSEALAGNETTPHDAKALEASREGSFKTQIVITGGMGQEDKMELIDVDSRQSVLLTLDRQRRDHSCAQISPGKLFLAGGRDDQGNNIVDCDYVTVQPSPPFARMERGVCRLESPVSSAAMAASCGGAFLAGGFTNVRDETSDMYHFDGATWSPRKDMPRPRSHFALLPLGEERLYAVGGRRRYVEAMDSYDAERDEWHTLQGPDLRNYGNSATLVGRRIYALRNDESYDELDILNVDSGEWSVGPKLTKRRMYSGLVSIGGRLVALGGVHDRSVEVLDLRAGRWSCWDLLDFQLKMDCCTSLGGAVCTVNLH